MLDKQYILDEIKRIAKENGNTPLGKQKFENITGIKQSDWLYKFWSKWSDAIVEAGFKPNQMQSSIDEIFLIQSLIDLIRELKKFPTMSEIRLKAHQTNGFPAHNTFSSRLGNKAEMISKLIDFSKGKPEFVDIYNICSNTPVNATTSTNFIDEESNDNFGFVYLMKSGHFYKIGASKNPERRNYELGIKMPEELHIIHKIRTDDPFGIEVYWHNRFSNKRKKGEWFDLYVSDVKAFSRRKFM